MLFSWWRSRRRKGIRAEPFPSEWEELLRRHCRQAAWLSAAEQRTLQEWIAVFVAEKRFEGCRGLQITDEVKVAIAAQAGLLTLGWDAGSFYFDNLKTLLVYPGDYVGRKATPLEGGGELEWQEPRLGETWAGGSMVLSWPRVVEGGRLRDGPRSVVIHECAHAVDMLDGDTDGVPPLPKGVDRRAWIGAIADCRARFDEAIDEGRSVAFDDYAAESPAEFFAVATECFFQDPHRLDRHDRELYALLVQVYRQDPKSRVPVFSARNR